jgi:nucleoside-triphosphatase THEP1
MKAQNSRIYILTGNVHTGKTTLLNAVCRELKSKGVRLNGLLSFSIYSGDRIQGYDGYDLAAESVFPLARIRTESEYLRIGRFIFLPEGQEKSRAALLRPGEFDLTVVDEVGPLELKREGYWQAVMELLRRRRDLLLVIRKPLLQEFTKFLPLPDVIYDLSQPDLQDIMVNTILGEI